MKQRDKKIKNVYVAAHALRFFFFTYKDVLRNSRFVLTFTFVLNS